MAVGFRRSIFAVVLGRRGNCNKGPIKKEPNVYFENIPSRMNYVVYVVSYVGGEGDLWLSRPMVEPSLVAL